jgi:MFS family permease
MTPRQNAAAIPRNEVLQRSASELEQGGGDSNHEQETIYENLPSGLMSPTLSLPLLNFIDMLAVSLVIPLLFQYYKNAGVTSANQRELLSSVFSSSQIVGGVVLGAMTDAKLIRRKTVLFLSFGGSAVAYAMIVYGGFRALIFSRVLVGLVKQTMTVTTSIMTRCTTDENRAKYMGR